MNLQEEKEYIKAELDNVNDVDLVVAIKKMIQFGKTKTYEQKLHPMPKEVFYERNKLSRKAIENDNLISQEEAKEYFNRKNAK